LSTRGGDEFKKKKKRGMPVGLRGGNSTGRKIQKFECCTLGSGECRGGGGIKEGVARRKNAKKKI